MTVAVCMACLISSVSFVTALFKVSVSVILGIASVLFSK